MRTWIELANMPEASLGKIDIAEMNLACANGLPGAERLDPDYCLRQIDQLAERVRRVTKRSIYAFRQNPGKYENSEGYFRALIMITVLQRDCGIRYNPAKIPKDAPFFPEDSYLFGIFQGDGGTCASLPVLYTAIGRRLGYPIKLVSTYTHCFCRWHGADGRQFNIEATAPGLSTPPDQHYREGVFAETVKIEKSAGSLISLSPRRELAGFIHARVGHWWRNGFFRNAMNCLAWWAELDGFPFAREKLEFSIGEWMLKLVQREPFPFIPPEFHPRVSVL